VDVGLRSPGHSWGGEKMGGKSLEKKLRDNEKTKGKTRQEEASKKGKGSEGPSGERQTISKEK